MDAIETGRAPVTAGRESSAPSRYAQAAYLSAEERRSVRLDEITRARPVSDAAEHPGTHLFATPSRLRRRRVWRPLLRAQHHRCVAAHRGGTGAEPGRGGRYHAVTGRRHQPAACTLANIDIERLWRETGNVGYPNPAAHPAGHRCVAGRGERLDALRRHHAGHHGHGAGDPAGSRYRPTGGVDAGPG